MCILQASFCLSISGIFVNFLMSQPPSLPNASSLLSVENLCLQMQALSVDLVDQETDDPMDWEWSYSSVRASLICTYKQYPSHSFAKLRYLGIGILSI